MLGIVGVCDFAVRRTTSTQKRHSSECWNPQTHFQGKNSYKYGLYYPAKSENGREVIQSNQPGFWIPAFAGMTIAESVANFDYAVMEQ